MEQRTLFCPAWWWCFLLIPLLLLVVLLFFRWHEIERDVAANATQALKDADLGWAKVETYNRGRDVLLYGSPESKLAITQAVDVASNALGVRNVVLATDVQAPKLAPQLRITVSDGRLNLQGELADQTELTALLELAGSLFGAEQIQSSVDLNPERRSAPEVFDALRLLSGHTFAEQGMSLEFKDGAIVALGASLTTEAKTAFVDQLSQALNAPIQDQVSVAPTVRKDVCQDLVNQILESGKINFESGKSAISNDSFTLLDDLAATARRCPAARFEIAGHTDAVGNPDFNRRLSQQRAQAVLEYLVEQGLDTEQFQATGYGDSQPIADNTDADGRAQNRRIEFRLRN